jgi:hypothetical protein
MEIDKILIKFSVNYKFYLFYNKIVLNFHQKVGNKILKKKLWQILIKLNGMTLKHLLKAQTLLKII